MREIPLTAYILNIEDLCDPSVQQQWLLPPPDHIEGTLYMLFVSSACWTDGGQAYYAVMTRMRHLASGNIP